MGSPMGEVAQRKLAVL